MSISAFPVRPRIRVISDNDYSGDPDGLFQLAHHLLSPSCEIRGVIGSHLAANDPFDNSGRSADNAVERAREIVDVLEMTDAVTVVAGSNTALVDPETPVETAATELIIHEAMRDDSALPLYLACGGSLTEIASALLLEPRIADRLTVVWIGGVEYPGMGVVPPQATPVEYNLNEDIPAARHLFNTADVPLWQVPRSTYRQALLSHAELLRHVAPHGRIGALLADRILDVARMASAHEFHLGEAYIYGDSPLVLLTALQSAFEPDPSSSTYATQPAPAIRPDGTTDFDAAGRPIRVYTAIDNRLMFGDLFAKLELSALPRDAPGTRTDPRTGQA